VVTAATHRGVMQEPKPLKEMIIRDKSKKKNRQQDVNNGQIQFN